MVHCVRDRRGGGEKGEERGKIVEGEEGREPEGREGEWKGVEGRKGI